MGASHFSGPVYSAAGYYVGTDPLTSNNLTLLAGVTAGTVAASRVLSVDANGTVATVTNLTATTTITGAVKALDASSAATIANSTGVITIVAGLTFADAKNIVVNATTGTKIGTATTQKLGFYNATPVAQQATTGTVTGYTSVGGSAVLSQSTFTGNSGSTAYTIGDVVLALKTLGFLAA